MGKTQRPGRRGAQGSGRKRTRGPLTVCPFNCSLCSPAERTEAVLGGHLCPLRSAQEFLFDKACERSGDTPFPTGLCRRLRIRVASAGWLPGHAHTACTESKSTPGARPSSLSPGGTCGSGVPVSTFLPSREKTPLHTRVAFCGRALGFRAHKCGDNKATRASELGTDSVLSHRGAVDPLFIHAFSSCFDFATV